MTPEPTDEDYRRLLELRTGLRRFLRWSEQQARAAGLTPAQHQLLLAIRGHGDERGPTVGDVADYLLLRHHSAVGLIDRGPSTRTGQRNPDANSESVVRVTLTAQGETQLDALVGNAIEQAHDARYRRIGEEDRVHMAAPGQDFDAARAKLRGAENQRG
jgi:DNA-binding MarR family transcriptional regulator